MRLDHLLSKEHTPSRAGRSSLRRRLSVWGVLASGTVDVVDLDSLGSVVSSTAGRCLRVRVGVERAVDSWWLGAWSLVWGVGVARCWALRNQAPARGCGWGVLVVLWLFGCWIVDASIFVAVCSDRPIPVCRCMSMCGFCDLFFCCVCVCGDKL